MTTEQMDALDRTEGNCIDPRCPFDGRHVRKDEGAADHCPLVEQETPEVSQPEEPIEDRLRRAWANGFTEGLHRGAHQDRWDR